MNGHQSVLPPSPPHSVARSSTGTGLYSMNNTNPHPAATRKYSMHDMESELEAHHRVLRDFLNKSIRDDRGYHPHNRARDKLLRLTPVQFQELSTDVYDELLRREEERAQAESTGPEGQRAPRFLLAKPNFHPKRNQARQKLSTLASKKFRELATDVLFELERRVPRLAGHSIDRVPSPTGSTASYRSRGPGGMRRPSMAMSVNVPPQYSSRRPSTSSHNGPYSPGLFDTNGDARSMPGSAGSNDYGRPLARQLQSNTMVPNKSTMVEDDDDQSDDGSAFDIDARNSRRTTNMSGAMRLRDSSFAADHQAQSIRLEQKITDLEDQIKRKDEELQTTRELREGLEGQHAKALQTAQELNTGLSADLARLQSQNAELEDRLQSMENEKKSGGATSQWQQQYQELEKQHLDHRQVADQVRQESAQTLQELQLLSEQHDKDEAAKEELLTRVSQLEDAVKDWRTKYTKTKTQLRGLKATSMSLQAQHPDATRLSGDRAFTASNGLVKEAHVTDYQSAINELLHLARSDKPSASFDYMRTIVSSVRAVVNDVEAAANAGNEIDAKERGKLKKRVSNAANNLMTTSRTFAKSNGLTPISLVDAAASNLTSAVIDLIKFGKIRATPTGEFDGDSDDPQNEIIGLKVSETQLEMAQAGELGRKSEADSTSTQGINALISGRLEKLPTGVVRVHVREHSFTKESPTSLTPWNSPLPRGGFIAQDITRRSSVPKVGVKSTKIETPMW